LTSIYSLLLRTLKQGNNVWWMLAHPVRRLVFLTLAKPNVTEQKWLYKTITYDNQI